MSITVVVSSSHQSPIKGVSRYRSAQSIAILLSVWTALGAVEKVVGVMRRMTTDVAMVVLCRVDSLHVLTKDSAVTGT